MKSQNTVKPRSSQSVYEQLWLTYFNDSLFAKGLITEDQHNRMRIRIKTRPEAAGK